MKLIIKECQVKTIVDFYILNEATAEEIHKKYYSKIPTDVFNQIIETDTISSNLQRGKVGNYAKWLLNLYVKGNLKLEDLYKAKEYITIFDKLSKVNMLEIKDINKYKSLPDMYNVVKDYIGNKQTISKGDEIRNIKNNGAEKMYEDGNFLVIHPKTKEAAIYYGKNTQWCTSATSSNNMFDKYNSKGPLYIIMDKTNNKKYQFHYETNSFMDENDNQINFDEHKELFPILGKFVNKTGYVKIADYTGFLDVNSNWLIEPTRSIYIDLEFDEEINIVIINYKNYGLLNVKKEKLILEPKYEKIERIFEKIALVKLNEQFGLYDVGKNKWILEPKYENIYSLHNYDGHDYKINGFVFQINEYVGLININGKLLLEPKYDLITTRNDKYIVFGNLPNSLGALDPNGNLVIEPKYTVEYLLTMIG